MNLEQIQQAIGGPTRVPHQPEGGSDVVPLTTGGLDKTAAEPFPVNVSAQQGAGAAGSSLTPHANQVADGSVNVGGNHPDSSGGPQQLSVVPGIGSLTAGGNFGANRPSGGAVPGAPVGRDDTALGRDQGQGDQGLNPALKKALSPRPGPFGPPSFK